RSRLPASPVRVLGHLDLEDPVPRGPGTPDAEADAGRLPPLRRGRRGAARDDPAPAAGRVPAAARDPRGAGGRRLEGAAAEACGRRPRERAAGRRRRARAALAEPRAAARRDRGPPGHVGRRAGARPAALLAQRPASGFPLTAIDLRSRVREVPDFPEPGIGFKDISPLLLDPAAL